MKLNSSILELAQKLISKHGMTAGVGLRTLGAMQLASARTLQSRGLRRFVTSDKRLRVASEKKGFEVLDPASQAAGK